jgi:N6-adenosine-specific RNA methylase IME4
MEATEKGPAFTIVLADPPWRFGTYSEKGKGRAPEQHYDCLSLAEIQALGQYLPLVLAESCMLLLWVYKPLVPMCFAVADAWGFDYTSKAFTWTKEKPSGKEHMSTGYYTRGNPEDCYLFTRRRWDPARAQWIRGRSVPRQDAGVREWIHSPLGAHSEKPQACYDRSARLFGPQPRLELFARRERPEWGTCLGQEISGQDLSHDLCALFNGTYVPKANAPACLP